VAGYEHGAGRLRARPAAGLNARSPVGLRLLGFDAPREGYLYVPAVYRVGSPAPLVVVLHGAGEDARDGLALLRGQADRGGLILLAPGSRSPT
jgi:phospholipase/carboxylesterase